MMSKKLKNWVTNNWMAKIASLLLATALWFLINDHVTDRGKPYEWGPGTPPLPPVSPQTPPGEL